MNEETNETLKPEIEDILSVLEVLGIAILELATLYSKAAIVAENAGYHESATQFANEGRFCIIKSKLHNETLHKFWLEKVEVE